MLVLKLLELLSDFKLTMNFRLYTVFVWST